MGLVLKMPQLCLLFFFCSWIALSIETEAPGAYVKIDPKTIEETASKSMTDSQIMNELAEAATKNKAGAKAIKGIKGLKVQDIRPPNMTVTFIKDVGMNMLTFSQITIAGKSFIGGMMEITVRSCMKTKSKMDVIGPTEMKFEVIECGVELLSCKTNLPSSMLPKIVNKFLNSTLAKVLPTMMCPAADKVVGLMKEKMLSVFKPCSCGHGVEMQYTLQNNLEKESEYIGIHFNTLIQKNGKPVDIPMTPAASTDLPPKREGYTVVYIPVNVMNGAMEALKEVFSVEVTAAPGGKQMTAQVTGTATPTYALENEKGTLTVPVQMTVHEGGLIVNVVIIARTTFAVIEEKLKTTMELHRMIDIDPVSGSADERTMSELAKNTVSSWNDQMPSLCLPSPLGGSYNGTQAEIIKDYLALYVKAQ